ncbi:glycosyltransferase family 4 protein [Kineothrix sedimenti]|uniref:Glycosyltransferase family 4 protein n=1 Tax=Kineothrix sedimenti TaxID=3123317 RepID=A0ABZ3EUY9_9FIRM
MGKRFRIAMIGQKRIPSREGGVEIVVNELSTRLVKKGYEVDAYNRSGYHVSGKEFQRKGKKGKYYENIRIIIVPTFKNGKLNAIVYSFLATLRALFGKYDVIHYHAEGPCAMLWIPKLFGIRIVATIHGLDWQRAKWGNFASYVLKFGEKMAVRYADEIIVLSGNVQSYFKETYGRDTNYIPNGIEKPEIKEANIIKQKYGLEKDSYILFLARLVPEKGLHYLLEAFSRIKTEKKLVVAGGSSHSFEYIEKVKKMAEKDKRVIFTDFVQGETLEELYSNAYLFVLPSDIEGMAISLLEAMSYGNCCVVSDIKENVEVVGKNGITFEKSSIADLKKKLCYLLDNKEIVEKYKEEASDFICRKYNWEEVLKETEKLYRR